MIIISTAVLSSNSPLPPATIQIFMDNKLNPFLAESECQTGGGGQPSQQPGQLNVQSNPADTYCNISQSVRLIKKESKLIHFLIRIYTPVLCSAKPQPLNIPTSNLVPADVIDSTLNRSFASASQNGHHHTKPAFMLLQAIVNCMSCHSHSLASVKKFQSYRQL